jgi:hypothetical protein
MIRVFSLVLSLIVTALVACRDAPPQNRTELLEKLHQCRAELPKEHPTGQFVSPCVKLDPSPLNGISRNELAAALGPPTSCIGLSEAGSPNGLDCPPQLDPKWSFHQIGRYGPELSCDTDEKQRCEAVRWIHSE